MNNDLQRAVDAIDWEFRDQDTQYLTHGIHRYSGKFIPQIARQAIELLTKPGDLVLDPYVGSGTTLLEAALCNRYSIGIDLSPLAVLISSAKVQPMSADSLAALQEAFDDIEHDTNQPSLFGSSNCSLEAAKGDPRYKDPWYTKWFAEPTLLRLIAIHRRIQALGDQASMNLALIAFSEILRRVSNAHHGYPNVMYNGPAAKPVDPTGNFLKSLRACISMVSELPADQLIRYRPRVIQGDATCLPMATESIDAIVTHPPYIGSIPYAEYGALSLVWLGHSPKELDSKLTGGRRQKPDVVERFISSYRQGLSEGFRVLKPGGQMFILIGSPTVRGKRIDLAEITISLAGQVGFDLTARTHRVGANRRANLMSEEALLFFRKPR